MRRIIEGLFFLVIPLLTIPGLLFGLFIEGPILFDINELMNNSDLVTILLQMGVLLLLLIFMIFIFVKSFRKLKKGEKIVDFQKILQAIFYLLSALAALIILGASVMIFLSLFNESTPEFFPLDNPKGEYKITRYCPAGQGDTIDINDIGNKFSSDGGFDQYCVEYTGTGQFMSKTNFFRVTIGKSQVNLESFLGKRVKNIKGNWGPTPWAAGLNIDSLELAE